MTDHAQWMTPGRAHRRGVLLLIVLSMLSLFMMLGVAYVVMASRARDASRGFARAIAPSGDAQRPVTALLDSAAMLVIRGTSAAPTAPPSALTGVPPAQFSFESLLEDQYGTAGTLTGTVSAFQDFLPLCSVTIQGVAGGLTPTSPVQLSGRVLTFLPSAGKASSHRILRSTGTAPGPFTCWIVNVGNAFQKRQPLVATTPASGSSYNFPPVGTRIVINGREHSGSAADANEAWDGHDFARNPFLAQVEPNPATPSSATVIRASMMDASGAAITTASDVDGDLVPDQCDNDNDGVVDGQFFDPGFPRISVATGNQIVTHMSCLILDLDGRLNVNAHGSIATAIYPSTASGWPSAASPSSWSAMPIGSGYGPADISGTAAMAAFNALRPTAGRDEPWTALVRGASGAMQYGSGKPGGQLSATTPDSGCRIVPLGLPALEGRYAGASGAALPPANATMTSLAAADGSMPGVSGSNDLMSTYNELQFVGTRSPIDLQARMKSRAIAAAAPAVIPTLSFAKPDNSPEFTDDPYEVILNQQKGGGLLANPQTLGLTPGNAPDNVFSIAELERLLRPYDPDSSKLAPRLFALLGSQAEIGRLSVTSESWDVPVVTGSAALTLFGTSGWFSSVAPGVLYSTTGPSTTTSSTIPNGVVPPDLAAGLKLDVTRSGTTDLQRRALFKDIYLTCVALLTGSGSDPTPAMASQYAQWAANVVEYQDADSTMTQFEYDPQPLDGWDVDGDPGTTTEPTRAIVWGAERPEAVITQTLAWDDGTNGELYVMLHRPWNTRLEIPGSPPTVAEPSDPALRSVPTASGSAIALSGTTPTGDNIWQLRIGTGAASPIVRFDPLPAGSPDLGATVIPAAVSPFVSAFAADSWICVRPAAASAEGVTVPTPANDVESLRITNGVLKAPLGTTRIRLERLADPTLPHNPTSNPYLIVDAASVTVVNRTPVAPPLPLPDHEVLTRQGWGQVFSPAPYPSSPPLTGTWGGTPAWMMWPNRPLVSIVELMHVPGFAADSFAPQPTTAPVNPDNGMLANYTVPAGLNYLPAQTPPPVPPSPSLLDVLRVPSRFAGTRLTIPNVPANSPFLANLESIGVYAPIVAVNQLDLAREPGRVNLNTISSDAVWNDVVVGGTHAGSTVPLRPAANLTAVQSPTGALIQAMPAETLLNILSGSSGSAATAPFVDTAGDISDAASNPLHAMHTASRLANTATNRSHLFAVWVTLRTMERTPPPSPVSDPDTVQYHRMFFIYDRSKPVAFEPGSDHNVRDGILLKRVLQ